MDRQNPSSSIAPRADRSSIRHRSGTFTAAGSSSSVGVAARRGSASVTASHGGQHRHEQHLPASASGTGLIVQVEDTDAPASNGAGPGAQPTVLLVHGGRTERHRHPECCTSTRHSSSTSWFLGLPVLQIGVNECPLRQYICRFCTRVCMG